MIPYYLSIKTHNFVQLLQKLSILQTWRSGAEVLQVSSEQGAVINAE